MLTVRLLGTIDIRLNGEEVPSLTTGRTVALLAFLSVTGQAQSRTAIANLLWNAETEQQARSNLRYALRDLRRAVGDYVVVEGESVSFNRALPHWIDSATFASHIRLATGSCSNEPDILHQLLNLYGGKFLTGFQISDAPAFEDWVAAQRRHLHDLFVQGLHLRTEQLLTSGEYEAGLELNHYLLSLEPWREEVHCQRMLLFAHLGQRSAALKQYELCRQILADELDVPPMSTTTSLYEQIKSGRWFELHMAPANPNQQQITIAALPKASRSANNYVDLGTMPEVVHFVGRQHDLASLRQWIGQEQCHLLALFGLAGQGKTALAAALVQAIADEEETAGNGFQHIIWRTRTQVPSCIDLVQDWLVQIDGADRDTLPHNFDWLIARLFKGLESTRCLLALDSIDAVDMPSSLDAKQYDTLLRLFFQRRHRSCLVITSRQRSEAFAHLDERDRAFRWLEIEGLSYEDSQMLLAHYGLPGTPQEIAQIWETYAGNPLLLTQAAEMVYQLFDGDLSTFVAENLFFLDDISGRLLQQLAARSPLELQLLQTLASTSIPLTRQSLWENLPQAPNRADYLLALRSLQNAFLLHHGKTQLGLPEVVGQLLRQQSGLRATPADILPEARNTHMRVQ